MSEPLDVKKRDDILAAIPEALAIAERTLKWFKPVMENYRDEIETFANFPSLFMGLVNEQGKLAHYSGMLRIVDATGKVVADHLSAADYSNFIGEAVEPWSYLKSAYYKPYGYPDGIYRVGPLARLNVADGMQYTRGRSKNGWNFASMALFRVWFHYHAARLIEILYGIERIQRLLSDPDILSKHVRAYAKPNAFEGIGAAEAPRGTLFHHYKIDENGLITWVNLIIATGQNNLAMNRGVLDVARHYIHGEEIREGALNRVEAVIRTFDPCLSCSTHAVGQMPLDIQLIRGGWCASWTAS